MKLRLPGPSIVIAIIALVMASAGSAVGGSLITSSKIKNGTIRAADIKKGSITSNRLSKGTQRLLRSKGKGGSSSTRVAYEAIRKAGPENQPANVVVKVASLTVPAGAYSVQANTIMTAFAGETNLIEALTGANGSLNGTCTLDTGGPTQSSMGTIIVNDRQTPTTMSMQMTRTVGASTEFHVQCSAGAPWRLSETSIIATPIDRIELTETTG